MLPPMVHVQSLMIQWLLKIVLEYTDLQVYWHQGIFLYHQGIFHYNQGILLGTRRRTKNTFSLRVRI